MFDHKKRFASHYPSVIITGHGCETGGGGECGLEDGDEGRERVDVGGVQTPYFSARSCVTPNH